MKWPSPLLYASRGAPLEEIHVLIAVPGGLPLRPFLSRGLDHGPHVLQGVETFPAVLGSAAGPTATTTATATTTTTSTTSTATPPRRVLDPETARTIWSLHPFRLFGLLDHLTRPKHVWHHLERAAALVGVRRPTVHHASVR